MNTTWMFWLTFLCLTVPSLSVSSFSDYHGITKQLLENYDKYSPPPNVTTVKLGFTIMNVKVREEESVMELDVWVNQGWSDPRLNLSKINSSEEISQFYTDRRNIWQPDLTLYNDANFDGGSRVKTDFRTLIMGNGEILFIAPVKFEVPCELDLSVWPYDHHQCTAKYGSWVYSGWIVDIKLNSEEAEIDIIGEKSTHSFSGWKVENVSLSREIKYYSCCPEPYVDVRIRTNIRRHDMNTKTTVQIPAFALCIFLLVIFLLPPGASEKVVVGSIGVLMNLIFLIYLSYRVPSSPQSTPIIVTFVSEQLITSICMTILSVITLRMAKEPHHDEVSHEKGSDNGCWRCLSYFMMGCCLCNYRPPKNDMEKLPASEECISHENPTTKSFSSYKYLMIASLIDRIILIAYIFNIIGISIAYSPYML